MKTFFVEEPVFPQVTLNITVREIDTDETVQVIQPKMNMSEFKGMSYELFMKYFITHSRRRQSVLFCIQDVMPTKCASEYVEFDEKIFTYLKRLVLKDDVFKFIVKVFPTISVHNAIKVNKETKGALQC